MRVGIVGAGWAGLAAAVTASQAGHSVTLFEMAPQVGGRARQALGPLAQGLTFDNGQHLLIGAYSETQRLMKLVGVNLDDALWRTPLHLVDAAGQGLKLPPGHPALSFMRGVWAHSHWRMGERISLLKHAALWRWHGFHCAESVTVGELTHALPERVRLELIEPLCVAALNTPAHEASGRVFLRVLRDALLNGPGSADLLFPRQSLSALWPQPAVAWLQSRGVQIHLQRRVRDLSACAAHWLIDNEPFEQVILACTPIEAGRLCQDIAPAWAQQAQALRFEPIATVYARSPGTRLPTAMVRMDSDEHERPAQFVLDHGHWGGSEGFLAFVVSGAASWAQRGHEALEEATQKQATQALSPVLKAPIQILQTLVDKRATFRCTANLPRPARQIAAGLQAAGDFVDGPYPATLEGAMRSGVRAAKGLAPLP